MSDCLLTLSISCRRDNNNAIAVQEPYVDLAIVSSKMWSYKSWSPATSVLCSGQKRNGIPPLLVDGKSACPISSRKDFGNRPVVMKECSNCSSIILTMSSHVTRIDDKSAGNWVRSWIGKSKINKSKVTIVDVDRARFCAMTFRDVQCVFLGGNPPRSHHNNTRLCRWMGLPVVSELLCTKNLIVRNSGCCFLSHLPNL